MYDVIYGYRTFACDYNDITLLKLKPIIVGNCTRCRSCNVSHRINNAIIILYSF